MIYVSSLSLTALIKQYEKNRLNAIFHFLESIRSYINETRHRNFHLRNMNSLSLQKDPRLTVTFPIPLFDLTNEKCF